MSEEVMRYKKKGILYSAIDDFKKGYAIGLTEDWPLFWQEFADQMFADLMAYETLMREKRIDIPKPRKVEE
jgi:hypothetical protein